MYLRDSTTLREKLEGEKLINQKDKHLNYRPPERRESATECEKHGQCYSAYSYGNDIRKTYYYRFLLPLVTDQIF